MGRTPFCGIIKNALLREERGCVCPRFLVASPTLCGKKRKKPAKFCSHGKREPHKLCIKPAREELEISHEEKTPPLKDCLPRTQYNPPGGLGRGHPREGDTGGSEGRGRERKKKTGRGAAKNKER